MNSTQYPVVAIILARQNSKGIPLKNLVLVGGVTLLERTIQAAIDSLIFNKILVSTDGEKIAQVANRYPEVIVVKRPNSLATDTATSIDAVLHALDQHKINYGISCLLQPTSPLRTAEHIKQAFSQLNSQDGGSVISSCTAEHHPYKHLILQDGKFIAVNQMQMLESPRQKLPLAFRPNGAIYFNHIKELIDKKSFFINPIQLFQMDHHSSIDIDNNDDLNQANKLIGSEYK